MNTVFARAVIVLGLVALPASALAKTSTKHSHTVATKDAAPKKKGKHHARKSSGSRAVAAAPSKAKAAPVAAKSAPVPADETLH